MDSSDKMRSETKNNKPPGVRFIEYTRGAPISFRGYQAAVLVLTFFAYASYHATRKTTSIVKSVLDPKTTQLGFTHWSRSYFLGSSSIEEQNTGLTAGWAPFDRSGGTAMLGQIDVAFLAVYSFGMYFAGHLGDRVNLRILLTIGMVGSGLFTALFGVGYWLNVHSFYYFLAVQMLAGMFQSTGWPSVVAVVGNWFGKSKRGLIMGIWNAHTSVGNIAGSLIAAGLLRYGWGWSFAVPGLLIAFFGLMVFLFLPVSPETIGIQEEEDEAPKSFEKDGPMAPLLEAEGGKEDKAVGFIEAWRIPGVAPFALCLFFSKLVAYTFLFWLPFYISHIAIDGEYLSDSTAGNLSTLFDVGGVVGGILGGQLISATALGARGRDARAGKLHVPRNPAPSSSTAPTAASSCNWTSALMFRPSREMFVNGRLCSDHNRSLCRSGDPQLFEWKFKGALATVTAIYRRTGVVGAAMRASC
ncbi:uncharacterized protein A4U43_C10F220 [Asparagus officinalis]|uniref:Major facilitator superfamily (MFS) profile domain-containing protein n=1 Tax=Asparagus officinalis TaxID=4686 RepID=A0A5P1DZG4_ASPOF|nr:uncharacterized protein A4U43_C10F220 [Asparagus officinalis]